MHDGYDEEKQIRVRTIQNEPSPPPQKKLKKTPRKKGLKRFGFVAVFLVMMLIVFSSQVLVSEQGSDSWFSHLPIIKQIKHLAESADRKLKGEADDRINILLLGMGGIRHEGGYLTDTIMLLSLEPSTKKAALISIPRDLAISVEDMGIQKINSINAYAEMEADDSGGLAISQALSDILNIPIDYYVRVDFAGFVDIVDELGGLDVNVENTLDDYRYPITGRESDVDYESRYEHLHVDTGWQHMNGTFALKYARSRMGIGIEGSDFARARRQQKIILAAKTKLLSRQTLLNPKKLTNLIGQFQDHISTNLKIWELLKLWDTFKTIEKENITNKVLDNSPNGLLFDTISEQGSYILIPRSGDFAEIAYLVSSIFSDAPKEEKIQVSQERATLEIRNGTWINGLASKTALDLEKFGFIVIRIGNSSRQNFEKSVIYDLTYGEKGQSLSILKKRTNANVSLSLPEWLIGEITSDLKQEKSPIQPDFILVVGHDMDTTGSGVINSETDEEQVDDKL